MEENDKDVKQDLQPKADSNVNMAGTGKQQIPDATAAQSPSQQNNVPESSKGAATDKSDNTEKDDELERLRKENERLKELQRLREENKRLSEGHTEPQASESKGKGKGNKLESPIIAGAVAVVIVVVILIFGLHILSPTTVSSLKPSVNAGASGAFFLGPDGESLGSTYINGLSDLGSQLAQVGAQQVAGTLEYEKPAITSNGPSPGYYVLVYGNSSSNENYDIIPITVPSNFSNYSISSGGKPTFVFIGAQGCPFCAGIRWVFTVALSRFGNFTKLFYDRSATSDANVPTLMFNFSQSLFSQATSQAAIDSGQAPYGDGNPEPLIAGAYYTSKYINFEPMDELGGSFLVNTTGIGQISPTIYNNAYAVGMHGVVSTSSGVTSADGFGIKNFFVGGVPFFDINNQYVFDGANLNAGTYLTSSGLNPAYETHADVLNSIENPTGGSMGQTVLGAANILTAQICSVINNTAPVCSLSYISSLEHTITTLNYSSEY
jgi:hypothetical protein